MLSLSRENIYKDLGPRPIAYTYAFAKDLRPRLYTSKQLKINNFQAILEEIRN